MATIAAREQRTSKMTPIREVVLKHQTTATAGRVGLLARLISWAASLVSSGATEQVTHLHVPTRQTAQRRDHGPFVSNGKIVHFPGSDQASLRRLAADMKERFSSLGVDDFSPFIFEVDCTNASRFLIDPVAYVEAKASQPGFRIVIDDEMFGYMTLETEDFESIHTLVCHYVLACLTTRLRSGEAE